MALVNAVQIERDPFARATLLREKCAKGQSCAWCGQNAKFHYYWEQDSIRPSTAFVRSKVFCSIGCFKTYQS